MKEHRQLRREFPYETQRGDRGDNYLFPSVEAFANYYQSEIRPDDGYGYCDDDDEPWQTTKKLVREGTTEHVERARDILSQVEQRCDLAALSRQWVACVAGAYPNIPDVLAGEPECMRKLANISHEQGKIRIYNCISCANGVRAQQQITRGIATIALCMALQMTGRPIELYVLDINPTGNVLIKLNTEPVVLSELCYCSTSSGFVRNMLYSFINALGHRVTWPEGIRHGVEERERAQLEAQGNEAELQKMKELIRANAEVVRQCIGATGADIVLPPSTFGDVLMMTDPARWVIETIEEFKAKQDAIGELPEF